MSAAVIALSLFFAGINSMAQETKDVPLPQLPPGAGKMDADAPKSMTKTGSGLQYRILRKGTGVKPKATNKVEVKITTAGWMTAKYSTARTNGASQFRSV